MMQFNPSFRFFTTGFGAGQARDYLEDAFIEIFGRQGTIPELQIAQGVSRGESNYGQASYLNRETGERLSATNNWTAAQCRARPPCPEHCFEATDTHEDGTPYQACFAFYDTPEEGVRAFLRTLYVRGGGYDRSGVLAAARRGDVRGVSTEMRRTHFFELPLERHIEALTNNTKAVASALNEPWVGTSGGVSSGSSIVRPLIFTTAVVGGLIYFARRN